MDNIDIENKVKCLWKDTFHDSKEYIDILFDNYFNLNNIVYKLESNKLISSLLGIEYRFYGKPYYLSYNAGADYDKYIESMYLCGLATDNKHRNLGIMTNLINDYIRSLYVRNIAFAFLIPANEDLIKYYEDRDFVCASYNSCIRYIRGNNFIKNINKFDYNSVYTLIDISDIYLKECADDSNYMKLDMQYISDYILRKNISFGLVSIFKSPHDIDVIIKDNIISHGCVYAVINNDNNISGIVFAQCNAFMEVNVQLLLNDDDISRDILLNAVQNHYGKDANITVACPADIIYKNKVYAPYSLTYSQTLNMGEIRDHEEVFSVAQDAKPFAMARIIKLSEILIFAAALYPDRKYSILVTHDFLPENQGFYEVHDGICEFTSLDEIAPERLAELIRDCDVRPEYYHLTLPEVAALIWRKKGSQILDDVIAIPRLPLNISLMLE